jgi:hypothetical protein
MSAPAYPHGEFIKLYDSVYLLRGSIKMGPGMRMNRNMVVLKENDVLTLINPVRMNEQGLVSLDALGLVKRIVRLGDFHGLDDAFYLARYECEFWAQEGQGTYHSPTPSTIITPSTLSPVNDSEFFIFNSAKYPEAALLMHKHKLLITTDSIQYHSDWLYFTWFTKQVFKLLGFKVGINIGGPWLKRVTPKGATLENDFRQLLALKFDAVVAAHGSHMPSGAKEALRMELAQVLKW